MTNSKVTYVAYNSKKQSFIFLGVGLLAKVTGVLVFLFSKEEQRIFASIMCMILGTLFICGFIYLLMLPNVAFKIFDDNVICFYGKNEKKEIDLNKVSYIHYYPAMASLKICFFIDGKRHIFTYLLVDTKKAKEYMLNLFKEKNLTVINKYWRKGV